MYVDWLGQHGLCYEANSVKIWRRGILLVSVVIAWYPWFIPGWLTFSVLLATYVTTSHPIPVCYRRHMSPRHILSLCSIGDICHHVTSYPCMLLATYVTMSHPIPACYWRHMSPRHILSLCAIGDICHHITSYPCVLSATYVSTSHPIPACYWWHMSPHHILSKCAIGDMSPRHILSLHAIGDICHNITSYPCVLLATYVTVAWAISVCYQWLTLP